MKFYTFYFSAENPIKQEDYADMHQAYKKLKNKYLDCTTGNGVESFKHFDINSSSKKEMEFCQVFLMGKGYDPTIEFGSRHEVELIYQGEFTFETV